jgi:hypothetical protein
VSQQTIPHATWTKVDGTRWEIRQDSGSSILVEVDEAGKMTVHADGPVELRAFGNSGSALRPDPEARVRELKGRRVRLTLTNGRTREGVVIGAGPSGFQLTSGIGGRMLFRYGEVDAIEDLGVECVQVCRDPIALDDDGTGFAQFIPGPQRDL